MTLLGYHGKPELKEAILAELAWHREQDKIVHGHYWDNGKGCAVGCTLESFKRATKATRISHSSHALYETHLGIPRAIAKLEDALFEALPNGTARAWPERFAKAIRPGADLSMVMPKFLRWLLLNPDGGVQAGVKRRPESARAVQGVIDLYGRWIDGVKPEVGEWHKASAYAAYAAYADAADADDADDADDAAAAAADAAAYAAYADDAADAAYADDAAAAAADAAAYAAYAAYAAADADAADAARSRERRRQADKLIELLEAA